MFLGSEDGEAVVGIDKEGELIKLIHLDPETIEGMQNNKNLTTFFRKFHEIIV